MKILLVAIFISLLSCNSNNSIMPHRIDEADQKFADRILFTKFINEKKEIVVSSWRELTLKYIKGDLYIIPSKKAKEFKYLAIFYFKNPHNVSVERIHFEMTDEDRLWMEQRERK